MYTLVHPSITLMNITKTCPCNILIFLALAIEKFQLKIFDIFLIFAQNIDCGYTLEPPRRKIGITLRTPVLLYKSGV